MDDLILEVDEPAGDMGTNGVFDFIGDQEPAPPPVVKKEDAANFVPGKLPDSLRPGEQPTKQDLKESYQVDKPAPPPADFSFWIIGGAVLVAAYILLGD